MRKLLGVGSLLVVCLPLVAAAQPPPPPPPPPGGGGGGGGGGTGFEPTEPKMRFDVGLLAGLPQGDSTFDNVDTSPGINLQFGYNFMPNIGVFVGARYFQIQLKNDIPGLDLGNFDLDFGGRYSVPVSPTAKIFGEAMLIFSTLSADDGTTSDSWSGIGFGARAGGAFTVSGRISIGGAISYTTATIDVEGEDVNAAWLGIEGFASFGF